MISYLIYSVICMGFILLFYHAVLAREKIYQINRGYLLAGLLFSLVVPLMPFGIFDSLLTLGSDTEISQIFSIGIENINSDSGLKISNNLSANDAAQQSSQFGWVKAFFLGVYGIVTLILSFRLIRHFYRLQRKSMKNPATLFNGHKVVLVDEEIVPHTFWNTIFVNKEQYQNDEISKEVLTHELFHAKQNHTLDILVLEILKTIFWFNPVLYVYKKAIQINHEYIADEKVLSNGADIVNYQTSLLKMRTAESPHYLSTSVNFNITKKRFKLMTQQHSTHRSFFKIALIIPFFVFLGITFGCEPASMEKDNQLERINLELAGSETIKLNGKTVAPSEFRSAFSDLAIDPERTLVELKTHKNVRMGLVTDVQEIIRENGALKINYSKVETNQTQSKESWRSAIDSRNILDLHINKDGNIIVNEEVTILSSLNQIVRTFITNNGNSTVFSESPENAIIAIKTDKRTPHDTYVRTIDKIMGIYDELRN